MKHPYVEYEKSKLWKAVDVALLDLQKNKDLKITTAQPYVVGYLCEQLAKKKLVVVKIRKARPTGKHSK